MQYLIVTYKSQAKKTRKSPIGRLFAAHRPKRSVFLTTGGIIPYGKTSNSKKVENGYFHLLYPPW